MSHPSLRDNSDLDHSVDVVGNGGLFRTMKSTGTWCCLTTSRTSASTCALYSLNDRAGSWHCIGIFPVGGPPRGGPLQRSGGLACPLTLASRSCSIFRAALTSRWTCALQALLGQSRTDHIDAMLPSLLTYSKPLRCPLHSSSAQIALVRNSSMEITVQTCFSARSSLALGPRCFLTIPAPA